MNGEFEPNEIASAPLPPPIDPRERSGAACRELDESVMLDPTLQAAVISRYCADCVLRIVCGQDAIDVGRRGVRGGFTAAQIVKMQQVRNGSIKRPESKKAKNPVAEA
jgi:hypothetical protein